MTNFDAFATEYLYKYDPIFYNIDIKIDKDYVYLIKQNGLFIYEVNNVRRHICYFSDTRIKSIDLNSTTLFILMEDMGIKSLNKEDIYGTTSDPVNISDYLNDYASNGFLSTNSVDYFSCNDYFFCATSISGVEHFDINKTYKSIGGVIADKCYQTNDGKFFYSADNNTSLYRVDGFESDWSTPDYDYSSIFDGSITINNIFYESENLYVSTISGVYVINDSGSYYIINKSNYPIMDSDNVVYSETSFDRLVFTTISGVYLYKDGSIIDYYTENRAGRGGEALNIEGDIIDADF